VLGALDARVEAVARECNPQGAANLMWSYATMGREPGGRVLAQLDARVEAVAKECSPQNMANLAWAYATVGALDARAVVLSTDFDARHIVLTMWAHATIAPQLSYGLPAALSVMSEVKEEALNVGGGNQNRAISLLDQLGEGGAPTPTHVITMLVASACRFLTGWAERTVAGVAARVRRRLPAAAAAAAAKLGRGRARMRRGIISVQHSGSNMTRE
jgi:hypothetical protein